MKPVNQHRSEPVGEECRLHYPVEDWIEGLLKKYPEELRHIRPKAETRREAIRQGVRRRLRKSGAC